MKYKVATFTNVLVNLHLGADRNQDRAERDLSDHPGRETGPEGHAGLYTHFVIELGPLQVFSPLYPLTLYLEIVPQFSSFVHRSSLFFSLSHTQLRGGSLRPSFRRQ